MWDTTFTYLSEASVVSNIEQYSNDKILIYPNPAKNIVYVSNIPEKCKKIEIISVEGKIIEDIPITSNNQIINLKNYKSGIYIIKLENTSISRKIVID